jgi:regulatory protein
VRRVSKSRSKSNASGGTSGSEGAVADDPRRARAKALELLTGRELTGHQLCEKLKQRGFSDSICQELLESFLEVGLVDDRRVADMMLQKYLRMACSRMVIRQKMLQSGLSREIIDEQLATIDADLEQENARKQVARLSSRAPEKAIASLQRKGFSSAQTRLAVGELTDQEGRWSTGDEPREDS